jgi:hypothetical protein
MEKYEKEKYEKEKAEIEAKKKKSKLANALSFKVTQAKL